MKKIYEAPQLKVVEIQTELGFASSGSPEPRPEPFSTSYGENEQFNVQDLDW